jgi:hypothetical protein
MKPFPRSLARGNVEHEEAPQKQRAFARGRSSGCGDSGPAEGIQSRVSRQADTRPEKAPACLSLRDTDWQLAELNGWTPKGLPTRGELRYPDLQPGLVSRAAE